MDFFSIDKLKIWADVYVVPFAINLVIAALIFLVGRAVARFITRVITRVCKRANFDESLTKFVADLAYILMLAIVVISALDRLGVKTTAAIAVLGAMGLAVGLALQSSLGNFAAGVMIVVFKPYKVGDVVTAGGHTGGVHAIKIFNTEIYTPDNRLVLVPNGAILGGSIENLTALGQRRVDMVFGIGYGDDMLKAKQVLEQILAEDERVLKDPAPTVAVSELADSSVNFVVRPWVMPADYWNVRFDTTQKVKERFDAAGISIPFPQQDVHMHQADAA